MVRQILQYLLIGQSLVLSYYVHPGRVLSKNHYILLKAIDYDLQSSGTPLLAVPPLKDGISDQPARSSSRYRNPNQYRTNGERLLEMERIISYCKGETEKLKQVPTLTEVIYNSFFEQIASAIFISETIYLIDEPCNHHGW